jgi:Tol biopolymer transport system component/DNA-binding winged helix-turn-helix (wHTH) protein
MIEEARQTYEFDEFRLDVRKRQLTRNGEVVPLYSKAFDLLLVMAQSSGRDLTKDELLDAVWPGQELEEANLTVNMSAVRKALGEKAAQPHYIINIPGRGYRFVADLKSDVGTEAIVIETQTVSHITVTQEIGNLSDAPAAHPALPPSRQSVFKRPWFLALMILGLVVAGAGSTYLARRFWSRNAASRFQQIKLRQLTNDGGVVVAAISPDGKFFASVHLEKNSGRQNLRLGQTNGQPPIELRPFEEVSYREVEFAPDGSSLYYTNIETGGNSNYYLNSDKGFTLYRIPILGGVPVKLRENFGTYFSLAPEGRRVASLRGDRVRKISSVAIANLDGSNEKEVLALPYTRGLNSICLSWSPDGSTIALSARAEDNQPQLASIFLLDVASGQLRPLSDTHWRDVGAVAWLKDGSGLLVSASRAGSEDDRQIWLVPYPNGEVRRITNDLFNYGNILSVTSDSHSVATTQVQQNTNVWVGSGNDLTSARQITFGSSNRGDGLGGLDWTPDGRIIYTSLIGKNQTVWVMNADGSNPKQVTAAGSNAIFPSVTADGRLLVFQSGTEDNGEIWRSNIDGSAVQQLTTCGRDIEPTVSPDGKWVVYKSVCDSVGNLWRVSIDGGEPVRLTERPGSWPGVSPDSQRIACAYWVAADKYKLAVISIDGGPPKIFEIAPQANFRGGVKWTADGKALTYRDWLKGIWRQPIEGGPPQKLSGLPDEKIFANGWSRDGKFFAFVRGLVSRDVVLITSEN